MCATSPFRAASCRREVASKPASVRRWPWALTPTREIRLSLSFSKSAQSYSSPTPFGNLALVLFLSSLLGHYMATQHDP
jgi:hypothetical protein